MKVDGILVGDKKEYSASRRDGLVDVTLEIRVRMTAAEAKQLDALVDSYDHAASVTLGASDDRSDGT